MDNLYVFAIGGSGERVMRSLILALASGVSIGAKKLIPVFIDNDEKSNALNKCLELITFYNSKPDKDNRIGANTLYSKWTADISKWPSFFHTEIDEPVILNKAGGAIGNLQNIIGPINKDEPIYSDIAEERDLLFTNDDLQMPLNVGFVGNPNIGSVVLNSLSLADDDFQSICGSISPNDGVFVAGSLFGGTGAAGFPLIINTFNEINAAKRPILGGVAVLPYFALQAGDKTKGIIDTQKWDVNSDSFDAKTRAALMYYDENMRDMDYLYYVGDGSNKDTYEHYVGGTYQKNPAHIVELMAAMCAVDFSKQDKPGSVVYKIPVWGDATNFSGIVGSDLKKSIAKFEMMKQIFKSDNLLKWAIEQNKDYVHNFGISDSMRLAVIDKDKTKHFEYGWGVSNLIAEWSEWVEELGRSNSNRRLLFYDENTMPTDDNLTSLFYTNLEKGLAKMEKKSKLTWSGKKEWTEPVNAAISQSLQDAYKKSFPSGRSSDAQTIDEYKKLPCLLKVISDALDDVIKNKCIAL